MSFPVPFANYTLGGSILTFAVPMLLFIVVAGTLYSVFSLTRKVPGHQIDALASTPGPAPVTAAVTDTATSPEGGGAAPSPGPAPVTAEDMDPAVAADASTSPGTDETSTRRGADT